MKRIVFSIFLFSFFLLITYICYAQLFHHGFIFEEWQLYAETRMRGSVIPGGFLYFSWIDILLGKGRIIGSIFTNYLILHFGNNAYPFAIAGIVGHAINAFLLYYIASKLFGGGAIAIAISLVFLTIPIYRGALSYFAATVQTVYAVTFYLLSLSLILRFIELKRTLWLVGSVFLLYVSLLFKQSTSFFVIAIVSIAGLLPTPMMKRVRRSFVLGGSAIGIVALSAVGFVRYSAWYQELYGSGGFVLTTSLVNAVIYPVISISHFIIPERYLVRLGTQYVLYHYPALGWIPPYVYEFIYSSFAVDIVSLLIGTVIWVLIWTGYMYAKRKRLGLFLIGLYVLSFIPIAVVQQQRSSGFLESRYYYAVGPAFVLLMAYSVQVWCRRWKFATALLMIIFTLFITKNISLIQRELVDELAVSNRMRNSVSQILTAHPDIPKKPIFYMEGGQDLFTHFGTGYMLALLYPDASKIPKSIFLIGKTDSPLYWERGFGKKDFEGYLTEGDTAVGFFHRKSALKGFMHNNPGINPKQLVGFVLTGESIGPMSDEQMLSFTR